MPTLQDTIQNAKDAYMQAKNHLCFAFGNIPEDRLNWSATPSARTPNQIVGHAAMSVKFINQQMDGTPFQYKTTAEAEAFFRESERRFDSREQVLALLEDASENYLKWLDQLTEERLATRAELPFSLGNSPIEAWLVAAPNHTRGHAGQLEYIQTLLGDRDWHF